MKNHDDSIALAAAIRKQAVQMVYRANASHIGGAFSMADALAVLYTDVLKVNPEKPDWEERDRFILSKGHCCTTLYAALALRGFFPVEELASYGQSESRLLGHASHLVPGVEWSTGSLGHGLGLGCGQAYAAGLKGASWKVYVLASDGELNEGSNWEALLFAGHHQLKNIRLLIDANTQQAMGFTKDIMNTEPLVDKLQAFHWVVDEVDGHNHAQLHDVLKRDAGGPHAVIMRTVKGKGVSFMENRLEFHYRPPRTEEELSRALAEIES